MTQMNQLTQRMSLQAMARRAGCWLGVSAGLLLLHAGPAWAQATVLQRADGTRLAALVDVPAGTARGPAVVLAPGQGYHMGLPALASTAQALQAQGLVVFRFNWAYLGAEPPGRPSPDLSAELQDLQAVLQAARAHPRVDPQRIVVAGKSLGSVVAWRAFTADAQLQAALLLTPVCSRVPQGGGAPQPEGPQNYPGLAAERRPTLWIAGDADPLCEPGALYALAASAPKRPRVAIVGGDHGFEDRARPAAEAEAFRAANLKAVAALAAVFVAEVSGARPGPAP